MNWKAQAKSKKRCERCKRRAAVCTYRYCVNCLAYVKREMVRSGYLRPEEDEPDLRRQRTGQGER